MKLPPGVVLVSEKTVKCSCGSADFKENKKGQLRCAKCRRLLKGY